MEKEIMMSAIIDIARAILESKAFTDVVGKRADRYTALLEAKLPSMAAMMIGEYEKKISTSPEEKEALREAIKKFGIPCALYLDTGMTFKARFTSGEDKRVRRLTEVKGDGNSIARYSSSKEAVSEVIKNVII